MLTKRSSAVAVGHEDYLAVAGGRNEEKEFLTVVEVYNGTQWMSVQSQAPQVIARYNLCSA